MADSSKYFESALAGDVTANVVLKEPSDCAKSVREECGKDEGKKGDSQCLAFDVAADGK